MPIKIEETWDNDRLIRDRLARLQELMKQRGLGALYMHDGHNTRYVINQHVPGGSVFVPVEGPAVGLIRPRDLGYVKLKYPNSRLTKYTPADSWSRNSENKVNEFAQHILDLMAEHGVSGEVLGVDQLDIASVFALQNAGVKIGNALPVVEQARAVKTDDEVEIYRTIGRQYAHTMTAFKNALKPGVSENELAATVVMAWYEAGGEDIAQLNVCAGENMNPWRRWPTQRAVNDNEFVGIDLHGRGGCGLRGDASRTYFVGERPTSEQRDLYRRAYDYLMQTIDVMVGGKTFAEVDQAVPQVPEKYQKHLYNYNIIHGVGLHYSGYPQLDRRKKMLEGVLQPNTVLAVECYFGEENSPLAVKLEENIVVKEGAKPEILAPSMPFDERFIG